MKFYENCYRDKRTRFYLPVKKIIRQINVEHTENIIGNPEFQPVIHYVPECAELAPGGSFIVDFGQAIHGGIKLNFIGNSNAKYRLQVKFGESVSECLGESDQDSSRKTAELEAPNYGTLEYGNTVFRFVQIKNTGCTKIRMLNVLAVVLELDLDVTGSFESSDSRLNQIWKTSVRTVHLCMQEYIYDGSKRDRIVWMGDMHPEINGILCAFSDVSIIRDSFEFLMRQASPEQPMNQIYTYSCWFIISVWDYYFATGDRIFLEKNAEYFKCMLEHYSAFIGADGAECIPERRFLDWPNEDNPVAKHAGIHALLLWMMSAGEKILTELNLDASKVIAAQKLLQKHISDPAGRKAPAALLTLMQLADRRDILETNPYQDVSTFYGYYMLMAKNTIPALNLIRKYWGAMLDFGATSFWEDFDLAWTTNAFGIDELPVSGKADIHADFGNYCYKGLRHSLSHGWSCGPAPFLSNRILGVKFLSPGGQKITVQPDLGDLEYVRGKVPTPFGVIEIEADSSGQYKIDAPKEIRILKNSNN